MSGAVRPPRNREIYIDAFRGLMALVMVQGHLYETLLGAAARANTLYQWQVVFHGSTAPGFLFASGFVLGLPRAPLSLRASLRRTRRLLFVLGVGYALHLPYLSLAKTLAAATPAERAALFACDALQAIAVTQLGVMLLQVLLGRRWTLGAGLAAVAVLAATPWAWTSRPGDGLPEALGAYLDPASRFPLLPFAAFVLAGTVAGAGIGRQEPGRRRRRALAFGLLLLLLGAGLALALAGRVEFWGRSPGYALLRLGGLLLLLAGLDAAARRDWPGVRALALLGHETLLVYVLHLYLLYGWLFPPAPLGAWHGRLGFAGAAGALVAMLPVLLASAWLWHRTKQRAPHAASLALAFLTTAFAAELLTRPW